LIDITECKVLGAGTESAVRGSKAESSVPGSDRHADKRVDGGYDICLSVRHFGETPDVKDEADSPMHGSRPKKNRGRFSNPARSCWRWAAFPLRCRWRRSAGLASGADSDAEVARIAVGAPPKILDLFAGIGTYAFPLSVHAEVTAIEGDAAMVAAMGNAATRAGRKNLRAQRRDLFSSAPSCGRIETL